MNKEIIKKSKVLVGSNSTNANNANKITDTMEPIICTKFKKKATNPQNMGKLTLKKQHASPNPIPVSALTKNFTFTNCIKSSSIFMKILAEAYFFLKMALLKIFKN